MEWKTIDSVPVCEDVLMTVKLEGKYPKFQVASMVVWNGEQIFTDWKWIVPPTHWMALPEPPNEP